MTSYFRGPVFYTWLFLISATVVSALLGFDDASQTYVTLAVLAIALLKCRFVIRTFMEVHTAPRWLQHSCDGWLLLNAVMLSSYYWR